MAQQRRASLPLWRMASLAGLAAAAPIFLLLRGAPVADTPLAAFFAGGLGLCAALVVARRYASATFVVSVLEAALSALVAILSIIAAVMTAFA
jgi:hypothetical protein